LYFSINQINAMKSGNILPIFLLLVICNLTAYAQGQLWGTTRKGGITGGGTILKTNADASNYYEVKKEWVLNAGKNPQSTLVQHSNGKIYGVTPGGGAYGDGVLYEYSGGSTFQTTWHLKGDYEGTNAQGGLVEASNGKLYGLTFSGGSSTSPVGTLFEFDPITKLNLPKVQLAGATGNNPRAGMVAASNGKLYGTCSSGGSIGYGVIFEYEPGATSYTVKYNFDNTTGFSPQAALIQAANGKLYGTTWKGGANDSGVLFEYDPSTSTFAKLHDFSLATGTLPSGALVQASNGKLYGLCPGGGADGGGTLYEYDLILSQFTVKHSFILTDPMGTRPFGGLTEASNGKLYGLTTRNGGIFISVVIEFDPSNGSIGYKLGATFSKGAGDYNYSSMMRSGNSLYGVSPQGGEAGSGVIFTYSPLIDDYHSILDFEYGADGAFPYAGMTLAGNGKMYGMVSSGGAGKKGLLYEFDPVTAAYEKKVEFTGSNGATPLGEMVLASNGKMYGTTSFGGAASNTNFFSVEDGSFNLREGTGFGVVFEYDPATSTYSKKAEFDLTTGIIPYGQLIEAADGFFYGVTNKGGANSGGTIYKFDLANNQITKLKDLPANAGFIVNGPRSGLTEAPNGKFYGVTPYGDNSNGGGIVYEYNPVNGDFTILKKFTAIYSAAPNDGNAPMGRLTLAADGMLYGLTTQGGENSFFGGSIFQVNPGTGQVVVKKYLNPEIGIYARGSFTQDASGKMYAFCNRGAWPNGGTLIQYDPVANALIQKVEFRPPSADQPDYSTLALYPGKMDQRIALEAFTPKAYGSEKIALPAKSSAGLTVTYTSSNTAVATVSGNVVTLVGVGDADIKGVVAGTDDYNAAPDVTKTLTVIKANQALLFEAFTNHKMSEVYLSLYAFTPSHLPVTFTSSDPEIASVSSGYVLTFHKTGTVTITASQPGNANYNAAANVERSLTLTIGDQTISFQEFSTILVTQVSLGISANASSGLPLTFSSSNTQVATVSGNQITILAAGTTTIKASQSGNANFNAAADVSHVLTISKVDQTIAFHPINAIGNRTLGEAPFFLSGLATSTLPLSYSASSDKITLAANQVTMLKAGSVTIAADQPGDNTYDAAPRVEQTFCINPAMPFITIAGADTENILLTSSAAAGNQWYLNGAALPSATQTTFHPTVAGVYTVKVTVDNCSSELSAQLPLIVTDVMDTRESKIRLYPNPTTSHLTVELPSDNNFYTLQLFHSDGSRMLQSETTHQTVEWDVHELPTGLYIVRVQHLGRTEHHKFIKR
jgi:uncharacterized repeat protein (TIGR03803 family)